MTITQKKNKKKQHFPSQHVPTFWADTTAMASQYNYIPSTDAGGYYTLMIIIVELFLQFFFSPHT